jgi:diguanylate cyclase (GGDEF)-like protein
MAPPPRSGSLALRELIGADPEGLSLAYVSRSVTSLLSDQLGIPTALLSRTGDVWRFEAEAWPTASETAPPWRESGAPLAPAPLDDEGTPRWTGIAVGGHDRDRSWMLLLPGAPETWESRAALRQFVPDIGALLEDAAKREGAGEWKRVVQRYHRFCRRLMRPQSARELYDVILRTLAAQVGADLGVLAVHVPSERTLAIVKTVGYPQELVDHLRIAPAEGVLGTVFQTGRPILSTSNGHDHFRRLRYRTDSYVAIPLEGQSGVLGVAAFTDRRDGAPFTANDLAALRLLAGPAGLALTLERMRQVADEVTRLASIDPLTGLFNRRYFDTSLKAELQRARRRGEPLALLMVDIDNFKAINDDHGHVVGDQLLRCVSDRLRRGVRIFDVCARYGGDEFAILMPSSSVETAVLVAERIRTSVNGHCAYDTDWMTVSIGVAVSDGREHDLLSIADRALFEAKAAGKNTVRVQRGG